MLESDLSMEELTPVISFKPLCIWQEPAGYWLEDTSTNGTLVNGERVAKHGSVPLAEGDKVQLSFNAGGDESVLL